VSPGPSVSSKKFNERAFATDGKAFSIKEYIRMKLQAQYSIQDVIALVEQDLKNKGLHLVDSPDTNNHREFILSLSVEQFINASLVTAAEEPTALPAPAPTKVAKKTKGVSSIGKSPEQLGKDRVYRERSKARKETAKSGQKIIVVTENHHTKGISPNDRAALAERQVIREQVVQQRLAQVEVKPETPALKLDLDHEHTITVYPVIKFADPTDPDHKHYTRMCKTCGWNENAECLTCKGRTEFQSKVLGTIEEIKKEKQEVVAPSASTFQTKEPALTR
jgi:hypothetical protein